MNTSSDLLRESHRVALPEKKNSTHLASSRRSASPASSPPMNDTMLPGSPAWWGIWTQHVISKLK